MHVYINIQNGQKEEKRERERKVVKIRNPRSGKKRCAPEVFLVHPIPAFHVPSLLSGLTHISIQKSETMPDVQEK